MAAEARDNRDIRKGQWQRWQQTGVSEEMWDNRGGGDGETGRRKRGRGAMRSYAFACPSEPRGGATLLVASHSAGYGGGGEKGKLVQIVKKCNEYRG